MAELSVETTSSSSRALFDKRLRVSNPVLSIKILRGSEANYGIASEVARDNSASSEFCPQEKLGGSFSISQQVISAENPLEIKVKPCLHKLYINSKASGVNLDV